MGDRDLHALERAAKASGDPQAGARWLQALVRAGRLTGGHLELLAYVGHPPAYTALGWELIAEEAKRSQGDGEPIRIFNRPGQGPYSICLNLKPFMSGLQRWGHEALLRAGLAAAWAYLPLYTQSMQSIHGQAWLAEGAKQSLLAVDVYVQVPSWTRSAVAQSRGHTLRSQYRRMSSESVQLRPSPRFAWILAEHLGATKRVGVASIAQAVQDCYPAGRDSLHRAIRRDLVSWLVEGEDPSLKRLLSDPRWPDASAVESVRTMDELRERVGEGSLKDALDAITNETTPEERP